MSTFATVIGLAAAVCTTGANLPQLKKAWTTGQTDAIYVHALGAGLRPSALGGVWRATKGHRHYSSQCHQPGADWWARVLEAIAYFILSRAGQAQAKCYELCFCCRVSLKRGPAICEAHSDEHGSLPISRI